MEQVRGDGVQPNYGINWNKKKFVVSLVFYSKLSTKVGTSSSSFGTSNFPPLF